MLLQAALNVVFAVTIGFIAYRVAKPRLMGEVQKMARLGIANGAKELEKNLDLGDIDMDQAQEVLQSVTSNDGKLDLAALAEHPLAKQFLGGSSNPSTSPLGGLGGGLGDLAGLFQMLASFGGGGGGGGGSSNYSPGVRRR